MVLEVQIQIFGKHMPHATPRTCVKFSIKKNIPGAQIIIFFCENWHEASFYKKEQMEKKFSSYFPFVLTLKTIDAQMLF